MIAKILALMLLCGNAVAGVHDGQPVNAAVTNAAFLNKNQDDTDVFVIALANSAPTSGGSITNLQRELNAICSYVGCIANQTVSYLPTWATNNRGLSNNSVFLRVEAIDTAFDGSTGHTHDGSTGNGPVLPFSTATSGTVGITRGGTGQTTASAAFNALSPLTTLGDTLYYSTTNTRLAGNTVATRKFMQQTGTGTVSAAPTWESLLDADIPLANTHILVGNGSGVAADVACSGDVTCANTGAITIANSAVTNAKLANMANNTVKANKSGGSAAPSDLTLSSVTETGSSVLTISNGSNTVVTPSNLTVQLNLLDTKFYVGNSSNFPVGVNMSGDATLADTGAVTIANDAVTNAKLANMATQTFKGRTTGGTGDPEDLTATQATAMLNTFTTSLQGVVPASGGGTTNFLRADGTFATPPGTGGSGTVTSVAQTVPTGFTISGSPVTTSGTLAIGLSNENANTFWAGPTTGSAAAPTFRVLATADFTAPTTQNFTVTGTQTGWVFAVTSANATVGATYTNNSNTFTVQGTIAAGTRLWMSGTGATTGGTLTKSAGTGDATITFSGKLATATYTTPTSPRTPLYLDVVCVGSGGGGGGSGTAAGGGGTAGSLSAFGANLIEGEGGGGGPFAGSPSTTLGTAQVFSPALKVFTATGGTGASHMSIAQTGADFPGGSGGNSCLGGGGGGGIGQENARAGSGGRDGTGGGGGGGGSGTQTSNNTGAGGNAGGCARAVVPSPAATYPYLIGTTGTKGTAGTNGFAGADGGTGQCGVIEVYN